MGNAVRRNIERIFGIENVRKWADLDKSNDQTIVEERIDETLQHSLDYIYGRIKRRYAVPFAADSVPRLIIWMNAIDAGVRLYDGRMQRGNNNIDEVSKQRGQFKAVLRQILSGQLHILDNLTGDEVPLRGMDTPFAVGTLPSSMMLDDNNHCHSDCITGHYDSQCCETCFKVPCCCH